jgi:hypothetical protein
MKATRTTICLMLLVLGAVQGVSEAESRLWRPVTQEAINQEAAIRQEALPVFTDVTDEAGIAFRHSFGDFELTNILEATGAGAVFFDYNNDGHLDLYVVNGAWDRTVNDNRGRNLHGQLSNHLFRNDGDGTFTDVTGEAGVGDQSVSFGCSAADFDADGDLDLYVLNYGPNVFYRNDGKGSFTDISIASGLADPHFSLSAPWLDYDRDGDLDVYVANYVDYDEGVYRAYYPADGHPGPLSYAGQPDTLYRNNGDGTFTDVTEAAGVLNPDGRGMSATASDVNNDGWLDIYVANDATENFYYENKGDGTLEERGLYLGLAMGENGQGVSSMGPTFADIDRSGLQDLFIPDMGYGTLLMNQGEIFIDTTYASNIAPIIGQYTGWAGLVFDYDNDGYVDIFVANGNAHHEYSEEDVLMRNNGDGVFTDVSKESGAYFSEKYVGRGGTYGDYDDDGDLDILVVNLNSEARLLRNDGGNRNNWLSVEVRLAGGKSEAIGARVSVATGELRQIQDLVPVRGYLSQVDSRLHFGLGSAVQVDSIEIRWPDGQTQRLEDVPANQHLRVVQEKR